MLKKLMVFYFDFYQLLFFLQIEIKNRNSIVVVLTETVINAKSKAVNMVLEILLKLIERKAVDESGLNDIICCLDYLMMFVFVSTILSLLQYVLF